LIQPALLGGIFIGVLSALPVISAGNLCCCMWIVAGGMLAAYLDQAPSRRNNLPRGALDGLLAGIIGAFVWLVLSPVIDTLMGPLQERMLSMLETASEIPPEVRVWLDEVRDRSSGPLRYLAGFMFHLVAGVIFATVGGLLGALFFWRDGLPPALGGRPA
jgi:hypothetical protein